MTNAHSARNLSRNAITPVWAEAIEVKRESDALLVRGWGHPRFHLNTGDLQLDEVARFNLLEQFHRSALRQLSEGHGWTEAGIYQFADATDDDKLTAFVRQFGPIYGRILSIEGDRDFGTKTLTVRQDMNELRFHQWTFRAAAELLSEFNRKGKKNVPLIAELLMKIWPAPRHVLPQQGLPREIEALARPMEPGTVEGEFYPWTWTMIAANALLAENPHRVEQVLDCAHHGFCQLLNEFPPVLFACYGGRPVEMPRIRNEGILPSLYYKLRLDYLAQRQIGVCLNCGGHFPVMRKGTRGCSEMCRRALRNSKYWSENSGKINKKRAKKNSSSAKPTKRQKGK